MGEIVNVLVAFAVIVFLFRWATSGFSFGIIVYLSGADRILYTGNNPHDNSRQRSPAELLGFRPKNVTQEMVRFNFGGLWITRCSQAHMHLLLWSFLMCAIDHNYIQHVSWYPRVCPAWPPWNYCSLPERSRRKFLAITFDMTCCGRGVLRLLRTKSWKKVILTQYVILSFPFLPCWNYPGFCYGFSDKILFFLFAFFFYL